VNHRSLLWGQVLIVFAHSAIASHPRKGSFYNPETIEPPIISTPAPQYGVMDLARDAGRVAGQYVLDQVNPLKQIENQVQTFINVGRTVVDGYNMARDLLSKQDPVEQLHRAAGLEPTGRDALEKLNQSAGLEPTHNTSDALQRLNEIAGVGRENHL
jgi:hypothetical protein